MTRTPRNFANCTSALPTPPEAPGINTQSVFETAAQANMASAVENEQEKVASSALLKCDFTAMAFFVGDGRILGKYTVSLRAEI